MRCNFEGGNHLRTTRLTPFTQPAPCQRAVKPCSLIETYMLANLAGRSTVVSTGGWNKQEGREGRTTKVQPKILRVRSVDDQPIDGGLDAHVARELASD